MLLDDDDLNADIGEVHGDAAAHGAGTNDADLVDGADRGVVRHVGDLVGLALGEEVIALGGRLGAHHQLAEQLALGLEAILEGGGVHRSLDALDVGFRRGEAAELAGIGLAEGREDFRLALGGFQFGVVAADLHQRLVLGDALVGEGDGGFLQLALFRQLIDQAELGSFGCWDVAARGHHLQRGLNADHAGQALGTAGTGQQAKSHFRQAQTGGGNGHAIVRAQGHFQTAAQRRAVDRGNHRNR